MHKRQASPLQCSNFICTKVLRKDLLVAARDSEPPLEQDDAGWYFTKRPVCENRHRLPDVKLLDVIGDRSPPLIATSLIAVRYDFVLLGWRRHFRPRPFLRCLSTVHRTKRPGPQYCITCRLPSFHPSVHTRFSRFIPPTCRVHIVAGTYYRLLLPLFYLRELQSPTSKCVPTVSKYRVNSVL